MMNVVFPWKDLPWGVLVCLLREWLDMKNTAKLDSAMSCREGRENLLEALGSGEVCYQGSIDDDDFIKESQVKWLGLRGVSLHVLAVEYDVTPEMLLSVTRNSPGLNLLSLDDVVGLSAAHMSEIGQSCPKVEDLILYNMQNADALVTEAVNHMHALERIELMDCAVVGDASLIALSQHCPHLKIFFINRGLGGNDITHEGIVSLAQGCRSLEIIKIYGVGSFTGAAMRAIANNCTSIKQLTITLNDFQPLSISDDDLVYFSQRCRMMTELELFVSHVITDAAVTKMVQYLSNLINLDLYRFTLLTDDAVRAIAKYLPNLTKLGLNDNENITDASIIKVAESCTKLTDLDLYNCNQITDASVRKIAESCTKLTDLNLYSCSQITDASMIKIAESCKKLKDLNLYNCSQISDATLDKLGECCPLLAKLDCEACHLITEDAVTRLKQRLLELIISHGDFDDIDEEADDEDGELEEVIVADDDDNDDVVEV